MKRLLIGLTTALAALLLCGAGLWLWSGRSDSLATALQGLARALPAGQTLSLREVSGSLRQGGRIGWLRWQHGDLQIEADGIDLAWSWPDLLRRQLRLDTLHLQELRIDDRRADSAAPTPPSDLGLPLTIDAPLRIDRLRLGDASQPGLSDLALRYRFDGATHRIDAGQARIAAGDYRFAGQLQAASPLMLRLRASGQVRTTAPAGAKALDVAAQAQLDGPLAGAQARLRLQIDLKPEAGGSPARGASAPLQASLTAQIAPWQRQPLIEAQGRWQALDLAALWPQAPRTRLAGRLDIAPEGADWRARVALTNAASGPLDRQQLPLNSLDADLLYRHGQWLMQALQASGAGGRVQGSGQIDGAQWRGQAQVSGIDPSAIDTRLEPVRISGRIQAQQGARGLAFDTRLQADGGGPRQRGGPALRLDGAHLQGVWASPLLQLQQLQIDTPDGRLQGRLSYQTISQAASAQLDLRLPGLQAALDGRLARGDGAGTLALQVPDARALQLWLARWPALAATLPAQPLRGQASLNLRWQGGWQHQARDLQLQASLRLPELGAASPGQSRPDWQLRDAQLQLDGTAAAWQLQSQGQAGIGQRQLRWQTRLSGGPGSAPAPERGAVTGQARIEQLRLEQPGSAASTGWSLQTDPASAAPTLSWQYTPRQRRLSVSGGRAVLQGPGQDAAQIDWQDASWSQARGGAQGKPSAPARWQSQGRIAGLPLAWIDHLGDGALADLGLSSDVLLAGHWELSQDERLRAQIRLERSAGDLRLQTDDHRQPAQPAGLREAALQIDLVQDQLAASLRWDSQRAGRALAAFSTQLQRRDGQWLWADDAPVAASVQAQLPPVDAWSALAPPGWRLRGTVDTRLSLDGTRQAPNWSGHIQARDLALRSAVHGIDFSQGRLDARMNGQRLDIDNFSFKGAGSAGGQLVMGGSVDWLPNRQTEPWLSRLRMTLTAQASALRLSSLPDRRLVLSGQLKAELDQARLRLRGALGADSALLTLPDDSTPQLGDDVIVRSQQQKTAPASASRAPAQAARVLPDVQVDLDLGRDFQIRGRGLQARLTGQLTARALRQGLPSLDGVVRAVDGSYLAYGQRLTIEQGELRFTGAPDNPALDILALRPNLSQRVGVQISGTAQAPVVRLYADPELPEAEKLAWLVLGRSGSSGGAEAAMMQQAALALLGGGGKSRSPGLAQALGLDELSLGGSANASPGSAGGTSVTLGKRLSNRFYVAFESGVNGAMGVFYIFYDLSRRFTLRAQTGEHSAIDLIFTLRYD